MGLGAFILVSTLLNTWSCLINVGIWQLERGWWWWWQPPFIQFYRKLDTVLNALYLLPSSVFPTALWEGFELLSPFCKWETGSGTLNILLEITQPKSDLSLPLPDRPLYPLPILHVPFHKGRLGISFHPHGSFWNSRTVPCISISPPVLGASRTFNNYFIFSFWIEFSSSLPVL